MGYYISPKGLEAVKKYQYVGVDKSLLANYIMQPFWRYLVNFLPLWMAPNVVTLLGFICIIFSYVVTALYNPDLTASVPSWVFVINAFCMFFYQTMDALDGKQARRTNTSSPLGELFDHGCDAVTTVLGVLTLACTLQVRVDYLIATAVALLSAFYLTQWEEYHTGRLVLGYIGVTEAQILSIGVYLVAAIFGSDFYKQTLVVAGFSIQYGVIPVLATLASSIATIASNFVEVWNLKNTKTTFLEKAAGTFSVVFLSAIFYLWAYFSPAHVFPRHPHIFILAYGFLVANLVGRIVLARVCCEPFPPIPRLLYPLLLVPVIIITKALFDEEKFLYLYCALAVAAYLHFAVYMIKDLCSTLKIRCFHIPPPKKQG